MSWEDRDYSGQDEPDRFFGRPGGDWQGLRPNFDNPLSWSVFLGRVAGIDVRIHLFFLLYIVIELLRAAMAYDSTAEVAPLGMVLVATMMVSLFVIVFVHEIGHCLACRWAGGQANEILMWPLGGLAFCRPRHRWQAHFITAAGGPAVNVVICIAAGVMLGVITGRWLGVALPNPVRPFSGLYEVSDSFVLQVLYLVNAVSLLLLLFNLLPIFPLDGGRLTQSVLWPRFGYASSMRIAVRTGYVGAILLFIFGMVQENMMIVLIAGFGGITCYVTHKQLNFTEDFMGFEDDEFMLTKFDEQVESPRRRRKAEREQKRAEQKARQAEQEAAEIDRILQKIADSGMASLTAREKKFLETHSQRRRDDG